MSDKKIHSFKKFTEMNKMKQEKIKEVDMSMEVDGLKDSDLPGNHNLPNDDSKIEKEFSTKDLKPHKDEVEEEVEKDEPLETNEKKVENYGKIAKFPKNVKASNAINFLESVKISKKSIWYIMVERQENELQMVKYNNKEGVDLAQFVNDLKSYYIDKYKSEEKVCKLIENIVIDGNNLYSSIKNIPLISVDGRKMISIITEDLIKLLSK